ncbi:uncharacterized protein LACBIDRAFT_398844 [Laccaria bicolor S238N-H82]|uniref:Predicted protein n=1 Tax=Laccaria bicolor (strain S238N-H82 / ATCC MYA-4686) TaxID=486041 RepID=B0E4D3_LACBS|nr:uncharacterized protein LACBIDRAFT_398844 [Laccaria bicolor S238N-H82]EDQ98298.1 predicted protein [Laccaria bicolor S238N-H82]|eukprot:XP_001891049.1 predicted protein [Laccaria bicolor S238N-H82]
MLPGQSTTVCGAVYGSGWTTSSPEITFQLLGKTVDILGGHRSDLKLSPSIEIWPRIADLRHSNEKCYQDRAQQFVEQFTDPDGRQAVYDQLVEELRKPALEPEITFQLLGKTVDILGGHRSDLKLSPSIEICPRIADLRHSNEKCYQERAQQFLEQFTDSCIFILSGHIASIQSVALSPDGRCVVSGSCDRTIRIWDAETGKPVGEPFREHTDEINSVAFSPDGRRIVSGSDDKTIRIWDVEMGKPVGEPLQGHTDWIASVAFSQYFTVPHLFLQEWDHSSGIPEE